MSFALFPSIGFNIHYARVGLNVRFDGTVEQIRWNYATTVSQMRCPYHHKNAWVDVEGETFNASHIDIVTCCEEFEQRVGKSLVDPGLSKYPFLLNFLGEHRGEEHPPPWRRMLADITGAVNGEPHGLPILVLS
jgi:hypothetical protein